MSGFVILCVILAAFTQVSIGQTKNFAYNYPILNSSSPAGNKPLLPTPKPIPTPMHQSHLYYNHLMSYYGQPPVSYTLNDTGPPISENTSVPLNSTSQGSTSVGPITTVPPVTYTTEAQLTSTLLSSTSPALNTTTATYTTFATLNSTTQYSTSSAPSPTTVPPVNYTASVPFTLPPAVSTTAPITTTMPASPTDQTSPPGDVNITPQPTATPYATQGQYGGYQTLQEYVVAQYNMNHTRTPSPPPQGDVGTTASAAPNGAPGNGDYDALQQYVVAQYNMNHNNVTSTPSPPPQGDVGTTASAPPNAAPGHYGDYNTLQQYVVAQYNMDHNNVTSTPSPPPQGDVGTTASAPPNAAPGHYGDYNTLQQYVVAQYNMDHNNVTSTPSPPPQGDVGTTASAPPNAAPGHYGDYNTLQQYVVAQYNMDHNNVTSTPSPPPQGDVGTTASAPPNGAPGHYGDYDTLQQYVVAQYNMNHNNVTSTPSPPPQGDVGTTASAPPNGAQIHYGDYDTLQKYVVAQYNMNHNNVTSTPSPPPQGDVGTTASAPPNGAQIHYGDYDTLQKYVVAQYNMNHQNVTSTPSLSVPSFNDAYAAYIDHISNNNNTGSTNYIASNYSQILPSQLYNPSAIPGDNVIYGKSQYSPNGTLNQSNQYGALGTYSAPGNFTGTPGSSSNAPKLSQYGGYSNPQIQYDSLASFYGPLQTDHAGTPVGEGHDISMNPFGDDLVATESGLVQGVVLTSRGGHEYFAFRGIPYAEKPKRFRVAQPVRPWTGVLDATDYGNMCPQIDPNSPPENTTVIGDEDCLNLNVFYPVPERCQDEPVLLPVLFHMHGGGFTTGAGQFYDPFFLMDECIVYVSINYRLGALGFVTTLDEQIPGNLGLKDSVLALQWVNDNVEFFRGNRYAITINGVSAGAVMVSHFIASPAAAGLFHRAISQSGSSLDTFGLINNPVPLAFLLGRSLDCDVPSTAALRACLSTTNVNDIVIQQGNLRVTNFTALQIGPVVEPAGSQNAFQTTDPYLLFRSGQVNKVPVITGVMANEAFSFIIPILADPTTVANLNENWLELAPTAYGYDFLNLSSADDNRISEAIRSFYLNGTSINPNTMQGFIDSQSDRGFILGMHEEAVLYSAYSHVYRYVMAFVGSWSYSTLFGLPPTATHSDDVQYLFKTYDYVPQPQPGTREFAFSRQLIQLWVSFIKTGYPTALWPNVTKWREFEADDPATLELGETTTLQRNFDADRLSFWNGLGLRALQFPGLA